VPFRAPLLSDWPLKLTALLLSLVLWVVAATGEQSTQVLSIPIEITPPAGRSAAWNPGAVNVMFVGAGRELLRLSASHAVFQRALPDTVTGGRMSIELTAANLRVPPGINARVQDIEPRMVVVDVDSIGHRNVPVHADVTLESAPGFGLVGGVQVVPGEVQLYGRPDDLARVDSVTTIPLRLTQAEGSIERELALDTTALGRVHVRPNAVTVSLDIQAMGRRTYPSVPVDLPSSAASAFSAQPSRVEVEVRGPAARLNQLTEDSVSVLLEPGMRPAAGRAALRIIVPGGFRGTAHPDSVTLSRRGHD
jgi:YbbR domain-containing protein